MIMKKDIVRIIGRMALALTLTAGAVSAAYAQEYVNTPVSVSKDKVRVNGEVCWSHVVLERQTLFSISKAYGVSVDEIYRLNPSLKETGLKKNAIILIPVGKEKEEATKPQDNALKIQQQDRQKKQAELDSLTSIRPVVQKQQTVHVKKWFEDLNSIAARYGVTPEAIMQANNLTSTRLANRQKLIIPDKIEVTETAADEKVAEEISDTQKDTVAVEVTEEPSWGFIPKDKVNATMLLPLKTADGRVSRNNMDFYSGALLAVYDLAEKGISTDFSMFDITDGSHPVTLEDIEGSDMIIGPVSGSDISRLLESFPPSKMVISPLDPRVENLVSTHANLIQVPTPAKAQYEDITEWIKEDMMPGDTVLVISEKAFKQSDAAKMMMEVMDSSGIVYNAFSYNILEGRDVTEPLKALMAKVGTSRVMIASESEAFVNDVVRNMNLMLYEQYKVVLYAASKIRSFETIEVEHFHKVNMHVSLTYFID